MNELPFSQDSEAFRTGIKMKNLKRILTALVLSVAFMFLLKLPVHAAANVLPLATPAWFDAEYYATAYPEVYSLYGTKGSLNSGFDATMWFHYRNFGVYEGKLPAASPEWFDADFYARTYPDVAAAIGTNPAMLFDHYVKYGRSELRLPNASYIHTLDRNGNPTGATPSVPVQTVPAAPAQAQVPAVQTPAAPVQTVTAADAALPGIYVPTGIRANGSPYYIIVDRTFNVCNVLTVGSDGTYCQLIKSMLCSTGRAGHGTPGGTFTIYEHTAGGGWCYMADGTWAIWGMRFRTGGYMFHSVCFARKNDPYPIPEEVAALGSKASLGCVRLSVDDAMWLYNTVPDGTMVTIGN